MTNEPAPTDDITQAFEALRGEVSLTRHAVEGLTAARERMPDYSVTLGQIVEALNATTAGVARIEQNPALRLSPAALTEKIINASVDARAEDARRLDEARQAIARSVGRIDGIVERGQAADRQVRRLLWSCAGSALLGMLLWSILPGALARRLPESWHVPEWMAARTMNMSEEEAGRRLIAVAEERAEQPGR